MANEPSIAESLSRAHKALRKDLQRLEDSIHRTSDSGMSEIRVIFAATRIHILDHFRFEEKNGYMDKVRKREPRLDHAIDQLAAEHRRLDQALDDLIQKVKQAPILDEDLRARTREWIQGVRQHEAREDELVQDAFNLDISAED